MKRIFAFFLSAVMVFSMVACGGNDTDSGNAPDSQPVGGITENSYNPAQLNTFGMPEPSFEYSYSHYHETTIGGDDNGNAILRPRFYYDFDCNLEDVYSYMITLKNSGFDAYLPEELPQLSDDDWLNYDYKDDELHFFISWHTNGQHRFTVVDKTKRCSYNEDTSFYTIDGIDNYESYGPHSYDEE